MERVEEIRFEGQTIRLTRVDRQWWVFCADAAPRIRHDLSQEELYAKTPDRERRIVRTRTGVFAHLVSARYLLHMLHKDDTTNRNRFRAWLRAWKIVSDAAVVDED